MVEIDEVLSSVGTRVTLELNGCLVLPFTADEVRLAMWYGSSYFPGWFPPLFFQKFCHIIDVNVSTCVLHFLNFRTSMSAMHYTHIVLIPKTVSPESMSQFRPTLLCNVIYKIASKALTNRLKLCMDFIISPSQSAFTSGRLISDNVLLAYELSHFMKHKRRGRKGLVALKLDMSKACD
ncbi:UNVERIFIED_CONTAM: hypothetical protein Slati_1729000 [Sesamum latifolium]|uniref:Reverse transcriptase domain-containing protein n=1 Tax=Sesamum latifolium TaxID=2727402 RepID=A0AAW2WYZ1_9LAMI